MRILGARIFLSLLAGKLIFFKGVTLRVNLNSQDIFLKIFNTQEN